MREIILKSEAKSRLPHDMAQAEHLYLAEPAKAELSFLRICANPDGTGRHTTILATDLNLKACSAIW